MGKKTVEAQLQDLYAKQTALSQKIKQIEREKSAELRKRQDKRERLVGKAIYGLVASGQWTEANLIAIMDGMLTRASDRRLFDLEPKVKRAEGQQHQQRRNTKAASQQPEPTVQQHLCPAPDAQAGERVARPASAVAASLARATVQTPPVKDPPPSKRLPENGNSTSLSQEFNL